MITSILVIIYIDHANRTCFIFETKVVTIKMEYVQFEKVVYLKTFLYLNRYENKNHLE